jgi:adenylate cyclase
MRVGLQVTVDLFPARTRGLAATLWRHGGRRVNDPPAEREADSTWARLRRRKVVQWGLVYVAAAWGFLQGLEYVSEAFHWPEQLRQIALIALLIGLPVVLVLAWYHGDRGQQRASTPELAILTLLLLLGGAAFWHYQRTSETATVATPPSPTAVVTATDRSIAVLPFVNMSTDKEQEYFADGISEEVINLLAQVPELRVIARTSSFSFKGKEVDIAEIARKLNVANVLEGSVRRSGEKVRITAQLVRASDSSNLWSETYERPLDNIFAVQDEIAAAVLEQLKLELLGAAPKTKASDPKAYTLFLQARHWGRQGTPEGLERSIALYERALAIDANDAAAWKGLANDYLNQASHSLRPIDEGYRLARNALEKALAIDSDYAPAHGALGWIAMTYDGDLAAAARSYEHALALEPTNIDIIGNAATLAQFLGRLDTASALDEYANARDPVNAPGHANLGTTYLYAGRLNEALESYRTALSLSPDAGSVQYSIGVVLLLKGDPAAALAATQKESNEVFRMIGLPMVWHALRKKAESDAALTELIRVYGKEAAYNVAYVLAYRGEADRAFEWLDKAAAYHDPGLATIVVNPLFANIHQDPRWLPFLRKVGKAPEQLAAIKFDVKLPN